MNWAWGVRLSPTLKLLLMALADIADDDGVCWPGIALLAKKCCVSDRTVQRLLVLLQGGGLLVVEPRFRSDGSRTSNRYLLQMKGGDKLSPVPIADDVEHGKEQSDGGDDADTLTTTCPPSTHQTPQQPQTDSCGGGELIFPKQLSKKEVAIATQRLAVLSSGVAQEVVDELAARMSAGVIRGSPLGYLRTLINRAQAGTFTPEAGIRVAHAREREKELEQIKQNTPAPSMNLANIAGHIEAMRKIVSS